MVKPPLSTLRRDTGRQRVAGADRMFWFEIDGDAAGAMARERAPKKWRRGWKSHLIEGQRRRLGGSVSRDSN
jgi:predicted GIY-YIG superfamily endonuclease